MDYDHNVLREKHHITAVEIDGVSCGDAVVTEQGHFGIFNTEAARRLEISNDDNGLLLESEYIKKTEQAPSADNTAGSVITEEDPLEYEDIREIHISETIKRWKTVYKA